MVLNAAWFGRLLGERGSPAAVRRLRVARPEAVRHELEKMAATWEGPPPFE